jgi:hypothetical protein
MSDSDSDPFDMAGLDAEDPFASMTEEESKPAKKPAAKAAKKPPSPKPERWVVLGVSLFFFFAFFLFFFFLLFFPLSVLSLFLILLP